MNEQELASELASIDDWCICHFKEADHDPAAPCHWYLCIPIKDSQMIICIITSQVTKQAKYYLNSSFGALDGLVPLVDDEFPFLTREESMIDCNQAKMEHCSHFPHLINMREGFRKIPNIQISPELRERVKKAIATSPIVKPFIKKALVLKSLV